MELLLPFWNFHGTTTELLPVGPPGHQDALNHPPGTAETTFAGSSTGGTGEVCCGWLLPVIGLEHDARRQMPASVTLAVQIARDRLLWLPRFVVGGHE